MEGEGQVKGKRPCLENPSSALTSTVMVEGVLYRFKLRSSESTISGSLAPKSSHYVNLSEYPPGTDIEYELHLDGSRVVSKVPRWAHEKWLRKYQNAGDPDGTITPEDTSRDAPQAFADGGKRPCEDHPNSASATAVAAASGKNALKRPCEDLVENPSATAAAYGGKRPCEDHPNSASATAATPSGAKAEVRGLNSSASASASEYAYPFAYPYPYAYADPSARASGDYPGTERFNIQHFVEDGRLVLKVDEYVAPVIKVAGVSSSRVIGGVCYRQQKPEVTEAKGNVY